MLTRKFGRRIDHRQSLMRNLATSVILYERVITTTAKAKEIRGLVERLINVGKEGTLTSYRRLRSVLFDPKAAKKIVEELAPRYARITGGYTTLTPMMPRTSDSAQVTLIELRGVSEAKKDEEQEKGREKGVEKTAKRTKVKLATKSTKRSAKKGKG